MKCGSHLGQYSKSPTYEPSGGQLSKIQTAFHQRQMWATSQLVLHLLSLMTLQLYRLSPPLLPPVSNPSCLFTGFSPCVPAAVLNSRSWTIRLEMSSLFFVCFLCIICVKTIINLLQWKKSESVSRSVLSHSLWPHGLYPSRLLCPWDSPGKNTGVGCHSLLQGIFPTQGPNPSLLHCRQILYHLSHQGSPSKLVIVQYYIANCVI